ncbi:unnamed protein product [Alopecurus aequalis]
MDFPPPPERFCERDRGDLVGCTVASADSGRRRVILAGFVLVGVAAGGAQVGRRPTGVELGVGGRNQRGLGALTVAAGGARRRGEMDDDSQLDNNGAFLDLLNVGSGEVNWDTTQDFSPIGEQGTPSTQNVGASAKTKSTKGGSKGKNWSGDEDKVLIEAWANTALDAVIGTDQHADSYWSRIADYYNKHKQPSWQERNLGSVNCRYTTISSATSRFCGCLQQILNRNQSGRTVDENRVEAHLLYIELDPKRKPFPFMHCYLEFSKYPKWETRELEVSQKKQKKKSTASPGTTSHDEDIVVSPTIIERDERPSGTKHEKKERLRRGKTPVSDGSACKLSLETVWAQKQEKDAIKEAAKAARYTQAFELQTEELVLKKREDARKQFELDERVMLMDTSALGVARNFSEVVIPQKSKSRISPSIDSLTSRLGTAMAPSISLLFLIALGECCMNELIVAR